MNLPAKQNPFSITKADDFTDQQINEYWQDLLGDGELSDAAKPSSPMPLFILGGKGSGKTHLLRYLSAPLVLLRSGKTGLNCFRESNYFGIYMRCSGLNAGRFRGKQQSDDTWNSVFAYYLELWLSQILITSVRDILAQVGDTEADRTAAQAISVRCGLASARDNLELLDLIKWLGERQRLVDVAVNQVALTGALNFKIELSPGQLVFGIPAAYTSTLPEFQNCLFVYLVDEFENLAPTQQMYINSLLRERQGPTSFRIGARTHGVRVNETLAGAELNRRGSEFDELRLDERLRKVPQRYAAFASNLVLARLRDLLGPAGAARAKSGEIERWFEHQTTSRSGTRQLEFVLSKYQNRERPWFATLRTKFERAAKRLGPTDFSETNLTQIIANLQVPAEPLLEKLNLLLFYRAWSRGDDLLIASKAIHETCVRFQHFDGSETEDYADVLRHFRADLVAQALRQCEAKQPYFGFKTFVEMSWGIPRNLLVLMKYIYSWGTFFGERPFVRERVSLKAQRAGVEESSQWFFSDARSVSADAVAVHNAVMRLGTLFREIRFSDKPSECSCTAFSCDRTRLSDASNRVLDVALDWALIVDVGRQRDRNSKRIDKKFQLNRMLAPYFELAIFRRGTVALRPDEVNAIFDPQYSHQFEHLLSERIEKMTAPFFGRSGSDLAPRFPGF